MDIVGQGDRNRVGSAPLLAGSRAIAAVAVFFFLVVAGGLTGCGPADCTPGEAGCACLEDGTCGLDEKKVRLVCENSLCVENACPAGTVGCACLDDGSCTQPASGGALVCSSGVCAAATCVPGQAGCPCTSTGHCDFGQCHDGYCVAEEATVPPQDPSCYTPCQAGMAVDGGYVSCPDDGLMPRCLDGQACVDGSCVPQGETPPACEHEVDCPDHQTCIQGKCYSNCDSSEDCMGGRECYRHVCRIPCRASLDSCPTRTSCVTENGDTGFCMPLRSLTADSTTAIEGTFSVSDDILAFSSSRVSGSLRITNNAPTALEFTVRKVDHTVTTATGPERVTTSPLAWLSMGVGTPSRVQVLTILIEGNGGTADLAFATADNPDLTQWTGRVEISGEGLGRQLVDLSYVSRPDGRWSGKMYHFASFGDANLADWVALRDDATTLARVGNAFIQKWGALRQGRMSYDEFEAVFTATINESWKWPSVREVCQGAAACYLYHRTPGYGPYSDSLESYPIPTGSSELPISFNLAADPLNANRLVGRIVTEDALHLSGDPSITLTFAADPTSCKSGVTSTCFAPLESLDATIRVGGRYATVKEDITCARAASGTFTQVAIPWLVPGFDEGTYLDGSTGMRYRYECRDHLLPFGADPAVKAANMSFAQSNPIADGRPRVRELELVDGALVNQDRLLILFRERFTQSFLGLSDTQGFSAYGFMILSRSPNDLDDAAYDGRTVADERTPPSDVLDTACTADIVGRILGDGATVTATNASDLARGVLDGVAPGPTPVPLDATSAEKVHYLCHSTGLFDGGPDDTDALNVKVDCPAGSGVTFFTTNSALTRDAIAGLPCQDVGGCQDVLDAWRANGTYSIRVNPVWRCTDSTKVYCDENRKDLRAQKQFYPATSSTAVFVPLLTTIENAFRYKTQFRARDGSFVGFAPEICVPDSNAIPYCYDPPGIEEARHRADCAVELYSQYYDALDTDARTRLKSYLDANFSYSREVTSSGTVLRDGFERLNAELLIMQGDEAYTKAFASRFDLAGSRMVSFQGSLFEPGGINLAGGAGNEMYNLYKATQYYQLALERFYGLSPFVWQSVHGTTDRNFISKDSVVAYFDRLIRASTQKSRAWSEVAKRYQSFNRPDLARHVIQRAYTAAYLESVVLSRMILRVVSVADAADRAFITSRAELATLGYRAALLDMREVYARIQDKRTFFGDSADYIPFPALEPGDVNAFAKLLEAAKQSVSIAAEKEAAALTTTRAFDVDAAEFQSELITVRNNYENQLSEVCGTFLGDDGLIHPAIRTYAYLNEVTKLRGDPCGAVGNGRLHEAIGAVELTALDLKTIVQRYDNVLEEIDIEKARVEQQCKLTFDLAKYKYDKAGEINTLAGIIRAARLTQSIVERGLRTAENIAQASRCGGPDCGTAAVAVAALATSYSGANFAFAAIDVAVAGAETAIDEIERSTGRYEQEHQCEVFKADSGATIDRLALELRVLDLEALKTDYRLRLDISQVQKLRHDATRLLAEKEEIEAQTIHLEAARNDPNVRIYKNDAVILADQSFARALRDAYRATKVFEYYSSQSYAKLSQLFLIRMVAHGDYNLETYLIELEAAYREFQQTYGNPDTRVEVVSLRDHVLAIPRIDGSGRSLTQSERVAMFRERLTDPANLDPRGHVALPFTTGFERLSPLTRNHKVLAIEAELIGTDVGDTIARLYLRQRGTGTLHAVTGARNYFRFPERTAVLNPFLNGVRVYTPEVYRSDRLRDRPFVNTHWELVINQQDELANKDINLQSLTDVRLYVYYTDFTEL